MARLLGAFNMHGEYPRGRIRASAYLTQDHPPFSLHPQNSKHFREARCTLQPRAASTEGQSHQKMHSSLEPLLENTRESL